MEIFCVRRMAQEEEERATDGSICGVETRDFLARKGVVWEKDDG